MEAFLHIGPDGPLRHRFKTTAESHRNPHRVEQIKTGRSGNLIECVGSFEEVMRVVVVLGGFTKG